MKYLLKGVMKLYLNILENVLYMHSIVVLRQERLTELTGTAFVSPSVSLVLENIGFVYPCVYDCNRPIAPILIQRRCNLMYDVY